MLIESFVLSLYAGPGVRTLICFRPISGLGRQAAVIYMHLDTAVPYSDGRLTRFVKGWLRTTTSACGPLAAISHKEVAKSRLIWHN